MPAVPEQDGQAAARRKSGVPSNAAGANAARPASGAPGATVPRAVAAGTLPGAELQYPTDAAPAAAGTAPAAGQRARGALGAEVPSPDGAGIALDLRACMLVGVTYGPTCLQARHGSAILCCKNKIGNVGMSATSSRCETGKTNFGGDTARCLSVSPDAESAAST